MRLKARPGILLALLVACLPAAAQTTKSAKEAGSISGRVTIGGKGVPYAAVMLYPSNPPTMSPATKTSTDQEGRYRLNNVAAGQYSITASAPAYVFESGQNVPSLGKPVSLDQGEAVENVDFPLVRGGVVTGRITDSQGRPIIGEKVYIVGPNGQSIYGHWNLASQESFKSDDRGVFRVFGLPAGQYIVAVGEGDIGRQPAGQAIRANYKRTYHPEATDPSQAKAVEVIEGGEAAGVDITVGRPLKKHTATGRVIDDATGKPLVNTWVHSYTLPDNVRPQLVPGPSVRSDAKGNFSLSGLFPGRYVATTQEGVGEGYTDPLQFEIADKDVAGLEIRLKRGGSISGVAVISGTENSQAMALLSRVPITAFSSGDGQSKAGSYYNVKINPDGSFRLSGLAPGRLNFSLDPSAGSKNFSILQVERDGVPQNNGIAIAQGEQNVSVRVVLGYGAGTVRGQLKVENGELPEGTTVWAVILGADKSTAVRQGPVDMRGRFVFEGLSSGEYEVMVQAYIRPPGHIPPGEDPSRFVKRAREKVSVTNGSESQVTMTLNLKEGKKEDGKGDRVAN